MIIRIQKNFFINLERCKFFHIHRDNLQRCSITIDDKHMNDKSTFVIGNMKYTSNKYVNQIADDVANYLVSGIPYIDLFTLCYKSYKKEEELESSSAEVVETETFTEEEV